MGAPPSAGEWEPYTRARLEAALGNGDPVFVDFTAAWCLTCKVNEMTALNVRDVKESFRRHRVVLLKADWTNPNADIEHALAASGRTGVPLYLLYAGGKGSVPRVLPQLLTPRMILSELDALPVRN
jgi:thiol:disulfide interchange protein DsbD